MIVLFLVFAVFPVALLSLCKVTDRMVWKVAFPVKKRLNPPVFRDVNTARPTSAAVRSGRRREFRVS